MFLFTISFILVFTSSYFIASILANNNASKGFIYTLLLAYANVIFTCEILSPFHLIKELPFLLVNIIICLISTFVWIKFKKPTWRFELSNFKRKFFNALKLDKSLCFLFIPWIFFILISLYLIILLPSSSGDAYTYHVNRVFDWAINNSLAHFDTSDIRITAFPINSELLYLWVVLFTKKQLLLSMFTFIGYVLSMISGYHIFKYIGYSMRKSLWTLFITSSFASVVVMISGTETDLIVAGLALTAIYLFINALKDNSNNETLFMSALAYAIAVGIKTPAILAIPGVGLILLYFSYLQKDYKSIFKFLGFGILSFILFSAFNYVQNLLTYGNISGDIGAIYVHKNIWGFKGFVANIIKHFFQFFDFSGVIVPNWFGDGFIKFERAVLNFFKVNEIPNGVYCGTGFFNSSLVEPVMGCGLLGFLLILPCFFLSLIKPIFSRKKRYITEFIFGSALLLNIISLSAIIAFMTYNTRFLTCFVLISLPIIANSYIKSNKNILKFLYIFIAIFYFTIISTHLWPRPFTKIVKYQLHSNSPVKSIRSEIRCNKFDKRRPKMSEFCVLDALVESKFLPNNDKILVLPSFASETIFLKTLRLQGYNIDFANLEHLKKIDIDKYDVIVIPIKGQGVTSFDKFTPEKIDYVLLDTKRYYPINLYSETFCFYNSTNGTLSRELGTDKEIPYQKVCKFTTNFYNNHPFYFGYKTNKFFILLNRNTYPEEQ